MIHGAPAVCVIAAAVLAAGPARAGDAGDSSTHVMRTTTGGGEIMSNDKVEALVKAGLSDELVVRMIRGSSRTRFDLTAKGVIELREAGTSEQVINVMYDIWEKQRKLHDRNIRIYIQMLRTDRQSEYDRAMRELVSYGAYAAPLLTEYLRNEDERIRAGCCEAMGRIADPDSVEHLFRALGDRNSAVRAKAARAVSIFTADEEVANRLVMALRRTGVPRDGVALALGYTGNREHLPHLLALAEDKSAEGDRAAAAYSLGLLGEPRPAVVDVLKENLLNETSRELREASARAMGLLAPNMSRSARLDAARAMSSALERVAVSRDVLALQLRHFPCRRSVETLLDYVGDRERDVSSTAWEALKAITGETWPRDADQWRSWWEIAKIQPRWAEEPELSSTPDTPERFVPKPLPEIPSLYSTPPEAGGNGGGEGQDGGE